ncbi:hypothetical protein EVAR_10466_1 [Eumeta japonica]|uniref:non-specific serine/threonine protein kinase n=1 Tax=Eumeta variegata TaxID=151549 RepID=A0A4C1TKD0_EUMVA|nr:hypothetical protein EVAR_10466_1 [Eumeta japonica]
MDKRYSRNTDVKYHRNHKKHCRDDKSSRNRRSKKDSIELEARTPPLPFEYKSSLADLLKERESIREQLSKIERSSTKSEKVSNVQMNIDKDKYDKYRKRHYEHRSQSDKRFDTKKCDNAKPLYSSHDNVTVTSDEDEENIIEERRKQRKLLLEKLNNNKPLTESESNLSMVSKEESLLWDAGPDIHKSVHNKECSSVPEKVTDMFSENDDFQCENPTGAVQEKKNDNGPIDDWNDAEGYYQVRIGELMNSNRFLIKSIVGQGVFANVVRAEDKQQGNQEVAIKISRCNDLMFKTGIREIELLKKINEADPHNKYHCIRFLDSFVNKGHLCLVLEPLSMDLRMVLKKFGKKCGINISALVTYSKQLLLALKLLKKLKILHADIKPDNILVNEKRNVIKLCDFGSASKADDNDLTPYLVSRFYRAPEIILGVPYDFGIDLWSTACTMYELATGRIMFTGNSNNSMLKCFMELKGKIPNKLIRKGKFKDQHFSQHLNFLYHKKDEITGREKVTEICKVNPTRDLQVELKKAYHGIAAVDEKKIVQLKDLLDKMTVVDSQQRLKTEDCLKHPFFESLRTDDSRTAQCLVDTAAGVVLPNQVCSNSFSPEPLHADELYHVEE